MFQSNAQRTEILFILGHSHLVIGQWDIAHSRGHREEFRDAAGQSPIRSKITVMIASDTMMLTIPVTTAEVAARPTAAELRPHSIPRRHPAIATRTPKTPLLMSPASTSLRVTALAVRS